ncbi:hypothetical protein [[Phormidium] sp. ETS-05]|uniref:hypothetical protein n=1 Tax=[Phormidium] sp. ETS-05 TaxID=222819 RepID=UPI0018EEF334|nr:hypothetical protein [[Phormidium] sp. ETS-05]
MSIPRVSRAGAEVIRPLQGDRGEIVLPLRKSSPIDAEAIDELPRLETGGKSD